jgi:hypothetical protein
MVENNKDKANAKLAKTPKVTNAMKLQKQKENVSLI